MHDQASFVPLSIQRDDVWWFTPTDTLEWLPDKRGLGI